MYAQLKNAASADAFRPSDQAKRCRQRALWPSPSWPGRSALLMESLCSVSTCCRPGPLENPCPSEFSGMLRCSTEQRHKDRGMASPSKSSGLDRTWHREFCQGTKPQPGVNVRTKVLRISGTFSRARHIPVAEDSRAAAHPWHQPPATFDRAPSTLTPTTKRTCVFLMVFCLFVFCVGRLPLLMPPWIALGAATSVFKCALQTAAAAKRKQKHSSTHSQSLAHHDLHMSSTDLCDSLTPLETLPPTHPLISMLFLLMYPGSVLALPQHTTPCGSPLWSLNGSYRN